MKADSQLRSLARSLRPLAVLHYAESRRWIRVANPGARFWLLRHSEQPLRQLQIPMDEEDPGFVDTMLDMVIRLAELESRPLEPMLDELLAADADVLRIRVANRAADSGQLTLAADVALREGVRRALLSSACSVVHPAAFHPRLSRTEADALLAACRAGQTERGSYVVKIVCPLRAVDETNEPEHAPFTRRVTTHLMQATAGLVSSIERGDVEVFLAGQADRPLVSANLCDALVQMHPASDGGQIELSTRWAADPQVAIPSEDTVPSRVSIKVDYLPEIERAAGILRPSTAAASQQQVFVGTVETLSGEVGPDGRRSGEVVFSLLLADSDSIKVRGSLSAEHYDVAAKAHQEGRAYVLLRGVLHRGARIGRIDVDLVQRVQSQPEPLP